MRSLLPRFPWLHPDETHPPTELLLSAGEGVEAAEDDPEALLPIRSLVAVETAVPAVELARQHVVQEMETSVQRGLAELVRDRPYLSAWRHR